MILKLARMVLLLLMLVAVHDLAIASQTRVACTLLLTDGTVINAERFIYIRFMYGSRVDGSEGPSGNLRFSRTPSGPTFTVPVSDIKELIPLDQSSSDRVEWQNALVNVRLRNGDSDTFYWRWTFENRSFLIYIDYIEPFTGELKQGAHFSMGHVKKITFGEDIGDVRENPRTKQIFPADFNFDPFTGEKLRYAFSSEAPFSAPHSQSHDAHSSRHTTFSPGSGKLTLVVTVGLTKVFLLTKHDLVVTITGPETSEKRFPDIQAGSPVQVVFDEITNGEYLVEARWGNDRISKYIIVSGDTIDFQMIIY